MSRKQHVVPYGEGWAVRGEGNTRISSAYQTKSAAIGAARRIVRRKTAWIVIHQRDGRIRDKDDFDREIFRSRLRRFRMGYSTIL